MVKISANGVNAIALFETEQRLWKREREREGLLNNVLESVDFVLESCNAEHTMTNVTKKKQKKNESNRSITENSLNSSSDEKSFFSVST